jgi:ADP-ribose pyrophosphatase YjhB (NUDIX family)
MEQNNPKFSVAIIGIIFNPSTKKILIGRRENDPLLPKLTWCFPSGHAIIGEDVDKTLKDGVKEKTGLIIKNLGAIFSKTYPEKEDLLGVYFLCESFEGEEKVGGSFKELKWVDPEELENYFTTSFHKKLKEFLLELK